MPSLKQTLITAAEELRRTSATPRLDAELLYSKVSGLSRVALFSRWLEEVPAQQLRHFQDLVQRRRRHEPVAYLCGEREFFGLRFEVTPAVLIPRPDTETVVELALQQLADMRGEVRLLDLGTGSGCLVIAIMHALAKRGVVTHGVAVDSSREALSVAQRNAVVHQLQERIQFIESSWFEKVSGRFDLIVANPPYIAEGDRDVGPEISYEPRGALYSGADGLDDLRVILRRAPEFLAPCGAVLCETGAQQHELLRRWLLESGVAASYREFAYHHDLAGHERVVCGKR